MKVLIIDDSYTDFKLAEQIYKNENEEIEILYAKNGIEGLHLLKENNLPDIILLDIKMPSLNGVEFLKRIRRHDKLNQIKIVITSASNFEDHVELNELNIDAYAKKPIDTKDYVRFLG